MVADKSQCKAVGVALLDLIYAVKDGIGVDDISIAQSTFLAALAAADDIKGDTDAAIPFVVAGLVEAYGEKKAG